MSSLFAFLSASREELVELHRAILRQHVLENALRKEQGLEAVEQTELLEKLERMLQISPEEAHRLMHTMEDELWEYSWYTYTDEWAWYRAKKDILKEHRGSAVKNEQELERLVEERYEAQFDRYVAEVDMQEELTASEPQKTKRTRVPKKK